MPWCVQMALVLRIPSLCVSICVVCVCYGIRRLVKGGGTVAFSQMCVLTPSPPVPPARSCSLPSAQAECSVRSPNTELPLCMLSKAEWPGDKRGRSGAQCTQSPGEGRDGGGGERERSAAGG